MAHGDNPLVTETDEVVARDEMEKDAQHSDNYQDFDSSEELDEYLEEDDGYDPHDEPDMSDPYDGMTPEEIALAEKEGDGYGQENAWDDYNASTDW